MIIKANKEILADVKGYGLSSLDEYINKADEMTRKWIDRNTMKSEQFPIQLDDNLCATYMDNSGCFHTSDISQFAFGQMCSKVGVPASYIEKCFNHGLPELAVHNYRNGVGSQAERITAYWSGNMMEPYGPCYLTGTMFSIPLRY